MSESSVREREDTLVISALASGGTDVLGDSGRIGKTTRNIRNGRS